MFFGKKFSISFLNGNIFLFSSVLSDLLISLWWGQNEVFEDFVKRPLNY